MSAKLAGLPEGVTVEPGRIEVRVGGAKEAVGASVRAGAGAGERFENFEKLVMSPEGS
jgi:hypothetical protein